jgi:hypothetical protein
MSRVRSVRAMRWAAFAALSVAVFEACTSSGTDTITAPNGPPIVAFASPAYTFGCDDILVVHLDLTNVFLRPPYSCGTQAQCGTMQVSLFECNPSTDSGCSTSLVSASAATADVQLDLHALANPPSADAPNLSQVHFVKAEFFGDSLHPFVFPAGGQTAPPLALSLTPATNCSGAADAGAAGTAGTTSSNAGAAGAETGSAGATTSGDSAATTAGAAGADSTTTTGPGGTSGTTSNGGASGDTDAGS